ncbi:hypothetical protein E1A91_A04G028800v1 [Gossypium mustelinum]|uniref:EF-hand domain-containing protein n=1 Tax=Gossypium mustelinum TaxID=34275 RepID=A0A5D2ZIS5_GOSMU|nr:hypothetical protein E1A91_A04G028800v1 [Gossypium mustelinum]
MQLHGSRVLIVKFESCMKLTILIVLSSMVIHSFLEKEPSDYFPSMVESMGAEGFIMELCNGFRLLMDVERGLITFESLKRNSVVLGLNDLRDDEIVCMLSEGDLDGDGALNQVEFCILMFRLSPGLMYNNASKQWVDEYI